MKKNIYMIMAAAAILTGCQNDDIVEQGGGSNKNLKTVEITAGVGGESRTAFVDGGVKWQANDALKVFVGTIGYEFTINSEDVGKNEATFTGEVPEGTDIASAVAYYPYGENVTISGTTVSAQYPIVQQYAANGSFGPNSLPMIGQNGTDKYSFDFKTLGGWLQLYVKGDATITKVVMKAGKDQKIAGSYTVTAGTTPKMEMGEDAVNYITLDCGEGVKLSSENATLFTFAVAPFTFAAGEVSFDLYDNTGKFMPDAYTISKAGTVIANAYYRLSASTPVNYEGIEPPLKIGNMAYASLEDAVADAVDGDVINLNDDITLSAMVTIPEGKDITVDLNGKNITVAESTGNHIYALNNLGTLTLKDSKGTGSITARGIYNGYNGTNVDETVEGAKMTIEGGKFVAMDSNGGAAIFNCAELIIKDGDFTGGVAAVNNRAKGVATINGGTFHGDVYGYVLQNNGGQLTIEDAEVDSGFGAVGCYSGTTVIKDGEFLPTGYKGNTCHVVYVVGEANVTINGGTFKMNYPEDKVPDSGSAVASYYKGTLSITGGTFYSHFDTVSPVELSEGSTITGGTYLIHSGQASNHAYIKNYLADGYTLAEDGTVKKAPASVNGTTYNTLEEALGAAASSGQPVEVKVVAGTYTFPATSLTAGVTLVCEEGTVFEGEASGNIKGATVVGATFSNPESSAMRGTVNGTFKDCTFEGTNGLRYCYAGETSVFENCVFSGSTYGAHFDGGANELTFRNCTFSGFNAFGKAITQLTLEGCTFKSNGLSSYNGANLWGNTKMTDCKFIFDGSVEYEWIDGCSAGKIYEFTNCTVNGQSLKISDVSYRNSGTTLIFNDTQYTTATDYDGLVDAIDTAVEGTNILLADGTYAGEVDLTGKKLNIEAANKNKATIEGLVWADNCTVTLKGLTLTNPNGVQHPNPQNSDYYNSINSQYPLIGAYNNAAITVDECTLDLTGPTVYGFYGYAHNTPVFQNSVFNCNKIRPIANNGDAITVTGCTFNDQYHYSVRIFENAGERQTVVFTNNKILGSNDKGEFEGINISKKGNTATIYGDFTIKGNTAGLKYRYHKNNTMDASCTYDTDIEGFAFEKEN